MDPEAAARVWELDDRTLHRFLMVVRSDRDQWYWTEVDRVERVSAREIVLHGRRIPFNFATQVYGMQVFDDRGVQVCEQDFDFIACVASGDSINPTQTFRRFHEPSPADRPGDQQDEGPVEVALSH